MSYPLIPATSMIESLLQSFGAVSKWMLEEINAGRVYSGPVESWLTHTVLNCQSCDDSTTATCNLKTWVEFNRQLAIGAFKCGCGGTLTRDSALIKVAVSAPLTNH